MLAIADAIRANIDELVALEIAETGLCRAAAERRSR